MSPQSATALATLCLSLMLAVHDLVTIVYFLFSHLTIMDYEPLEVVGHGSFGLIRKVRRISDGALFARKEVSYKQMNAKERNQLKAEFRILKRLDHPNIVRYLHHDFITSCEQVHLYMEFCGGGDLSAVIRRLRETGSYMPEHDVWNVFVQLVLALYRCHYNADPPKLEYPFQQLDQDPQTPVAFILHRDIKPENIFLGKNGNIKLGDFGLAKLLDGDNPLANTYVGTPYYMSPEVLMDQPSTPLSDIWSLGCVLYELCTHSPPFKAKTHFQLTQMVQTGKFRPIPEDLYSFGLRQTIYMCLNVNPSDRPSTAVLLNLDILKIYRKERELALREEQLRIKEQQYKELLEKRLEQKIEKYIEEEVQLRLKERTSSSQQIQQARLRGPRAFKHMDSPRMPLDDIKNETYV